ncbi:hypothetical protein [Rossellomorea vietnamensis]|uniref:Aldolase n=1 Tax=Rossellomorea vietnamensis TaxID=218284 RepID=A0A0P6VZ20_9BACI|nr:hypothetical protein [Rossellomorea vietnamensis]KPL58247.1 hypothetical protein AM506_17415 [Rossellomorea vietnamensis]
MSITKKKFAYKAFGLTLLSDILMPELIPALEDQTRVDITVNISNGFPLNSPLVNTPFKHIVEGDEVIFYIPEVGSFSVVQDKKIIVNQINDRVDQGLVRLYILGTCMGIILLKNNILPLHGSAIVIGDKAYAFIGDSGMGKSTLASAFVKKGYPILTDDIIPISHSREKGYCIIPSYPHQKLWLQSLDNLGMSREHYHSIYGREDKYSIPVKDHFITQPVRVAGIFVLGKTSEFQPIMSEFTKLEGLHALYLQTYRNFLISRFGLLDWHLTLTANMINEIPLYKLERPCSGFSIKQLVSIILNKVRVEME